MEIPPLSRMSPVASSNHNAENLSALVRKKINLFETDKVENEIDNEDKETESFGEVGKDFYEEDEGRSAVVTSQSKRIHSEGKQPKKRCVRKRRVTANLAGTKYDIVRKVCLQNGMIITRDDDFHSFLIWNDTAVSVERIIELKSFQKINHFPSMGEICRKDNLARNMAKMQRAHPEEYNFIPQTWVFPAEYAAFQGYCRELKKRKKYKTFIVKPANGAMGNGISLIRNGDRLPSHELMVIQEYIDKPFLLEGFKFDLRVYVLVTSCDPLRIFLYNDGLVRMGTQVYEAPSDNNLASSNVVRSALFIMWRTD